MLVSWSLAASVKGVVLKMGLGKNHGADIDFKILWWNEPLILSCTIDHTHCPRLTYSLTISIELYLWLNSIRVRESDWNEGISWHITIDQLQQQRISHSERGNEEEEEERSRLGLSGRVDLSSRAHSSTIHFQPVSINWLRPKFMKGKGYFGLSAHKTWYFGDLNICEHSTVRWLSRLQNTEI